MDIIQNREFEELESILPEDFIPIAKDFLTGIDEIARKIAQIHEDPSKREEVLNELCIDGDTYISLRFPYSQEEDTKLFFVGQKMWNDLLSCPDIRFREAGAPDPYDLGTLNDDQLKALFEAIIKKLKELRELSDLVNYKRCIMFLLSRIFNDFTNRTNPDSAFVDELIEKRRKIIKELT